MKKNRSVVYLITFAIAFAAIAYVFSGLLFHVGAIPSYRDATHFYYPLFLYLKSCFEAGDIPYWTPQFNLGFPLAANPTTALFYPPTWILATPIPAWLAFNAYIIGHVILAFGTMFFLVRRWGRSVSAGIVAALSYSVGGIVLFQYSNLPFLVSAAWLPLGAYGVERALRTGRLRYVSLAGMVLALCVLGGDVQTAYHVGILAVVLAVILSWGNAAQLRKSRTESKGNIVFEFIYSARRSVLTLAGIALVGFLLSAIQVLPTLELTAHSDRSELDNSVKAAEMRNAFSVPPWRILEFAAPEIYGRQFPIYQRWIDALPGSDVAVWVPSLYMGTIPFFLACLSLTFRRSNPRRVWMSWIIVIALLASMGRLSIGYLIQSVGYWSGTDYQNVSSGWGGVYWIMTQTFPGYAMFRYPAKWLPVAAMGISVLSAYGWDRLWQDDRFKHRLVVCLGATAIALVVWRFLEPVILPAVTKGLTSSLYGPYVGDWELQNVSAEISTLNLRFVSAFLLFAACMTLKCQKSPLNPLILIFIFALDLSAYSQRLTTSTDSAIFNSAVADFSQPPRRICRVGANWLPKRFEQTSSQNREMELAQWNCESLYAYNGLCQHATTMRYGGTFFLKNYAQFLRDGSKRGIVAELSFCHQLMYFDGEKITVKDNNIRQKNGDFTAVAAVEYIGSNHFRITGNFAAPQRIPVSYYPGWTATMKQVSPVGNAEPVPARVYESGDGLLAVDVPKEGDWTVDFYYCPRWVYIGSIVSLGAWIAVIFIMFLGKKKKILYFS